MTYLCPKCGQPMVCVSLTSMPPRTLYRCWACGYNSIPLQLLPDFVPLPVWLRSDEEKEVDE